MKVGIITNGLTGILLESFELSRRLLAEGHQVSHFCPWDVAQRVEENGFSFVQLPPVNLFSNHEAFSSDTLGGWKSRWQYFFPRSKKKARAFLGMDAMENALETSDMDYFIIDMQMHEPIFACQKLGIPHVLFSQWFSLHQSSTNPSLRTELIPEHGWKSRLKVGLSWKMELAKVWARRRVHDALLLDARRRMLYRLAPKYGIKRSSLIKRTFPSAFIYKDKMTLSSTLAELEFEPSPAPHLAIGPLVFESRKDGKNNPERDERLQEIKAKKSEQGVQVIYCSVSSLIAGDASFLDNLIDAVGKRPEWELIIGLGGKIKAETFKDLPSNVHPFDWVPQLKVLSFADLSINHAGIHSVNECIHFGVPMLIYSGKKYDQDGTAARLQASGCAFRADKDLSSPADIRTDIDRVLKTPSYKQQVEVYRSHYQSYRGRMLGDLLK